MFMRARAILGAVILAVAVGASPLVAEPARPAAAGSGELVDWVHLLSGQHATFRAAGKQFPLQVGTPLLRSDTIEVPAGEFVVVKLHNGYVVKIDEDTTLAVSQIVSLDAPPTKESLAAQLDRVLTKEERGRSERIAGGQARLAGADSVAPQSGSPGLGGLGLRGTGTGGGGLGSIGSGLGKGSGLGSGYGSGHLGGGGGRAPSIKLAEVEVQGPLDKNLVTIITRRHQNEIRFCYETALLRNPVVAGKLVLKLIVDGQGAVTSALAASALGDPTLGACAVGRAKQWRFPAPAAGDKKPPTVVLTLPFDLAPAAN